MSRVSIYALIVSLAAGSPVRAQLFENLKAFGARLDTGDPEITFPIEGPKDLALGDLDGDAKIDIVASNLDATVTVFWGAGNGTFSDPMHLRTGANTLRGVLIADLTGDGIEDVATAAPNTTGNPNLVPGGTVFIFAGAGHRDFAEPIEITLDFFGRDIAAGDFDGDGELELVVAGSGAGLRQYRRAPNGSFIAATSLPELDAHGWTKPVYSLKVLRAAGASRDELVVTHAWSDMVWVLAVGAGGALEVKARTTGLLSSLNARSGAYAIDVAPVASLAASGLPDLISAHRDVGVVQVRKGVQGPERFSPQVYQEIAVPGGPRSLRVVDLDGDGWNDLVVVLRYLDRVLVYRNENGKLKPSTETPTGRSPRELATADLNGDGRLDFAVINRLSADVSLLFGHPGQAGFSLLDETYLVDGEVGGLSVLDWDKDGRDDVIQLHRASGDLSVRLAGSGGTLGDPKFYPVGILPSAQSLVDVNHDGITDVVVANLGQRGDGGGYITVRLGLPDGALGPELKIQLPPDAAGSLFALETADFDGDGNLDLAAGYFDCRLAFFKGDGQGAFTFTQKHFFVYESRVMTAQDFDQDGDIDLAGAGYAGDVLVVENRGDLMTTENLTRHEYQPPTEGKFGTKDIKATDLNDDGDPDLIVGSGHGAMIFVGLPGVEFALASLVVGGTDFPVSGLAIADFDGDSKRDMAVACQILSCVTLLTGDPRGQFVPALSVDVPAGRLIASGDLDGDGHADLVGSGSVLWTALSSRRASRTGPPQLIATRTPIQSVVINEILAVNNSWPLAADGGRTVDWIELYNGSAEAVQLGGHKLIVTTTDPAEEPKLYTFPPDSRIEKDGHLVLVCSKNVRSPYHTGFKIPGGGATVRLVKSNDAIVDSVTYPEQRENLSYGRYKDGIASFAFNNFPSPGLSNPDNGPVPPLMELDAAWPARPGDPIVFRATGRDDVGIVSASVLWRRVDGGDSTEHRVILYDDGMHEDGAALDGTFVGSLEPGLPAGAEIRFHLDVEDLSDNLVSIPDAGSNAEEGESRVEYSLAVGSSLPRLEISEVVAKNESGLKDESGGTPDWVEVQNCSDQQVSLDGVFLAKRFPANDNWYAFPAGTSLAPGERLVTFCDGNASQGPRHAPFVLDLGGDQVFLVGTAPHGSHGLIDLVEYGPQQPDTAFARLGCSGPWVTAEPTPGAPTGKTAVEMGDVDASGKLDISDAIVILGSLFLGGHTACPSAADVNGDEIVDLSDAVYLLIYLFGGGPPPSARPTKCVRT